MCINVLDKCGKYLVHDTFPFVFNVKLWPATSHPWFSIGRYIPNASSGYSLCDLYLTALPTCVYACKIYFQVHS